MSFSLHSYYIWAPHIVFLIHIYKLVLYLKLLKCKQEHVLFHSLWKWWRGLSSRWYLCIYWKRLSTKDQVSLAPQCWSEVICVAETAMAVRCGRVWCVQRSLFTPTSWMAPPCRCNVNRETWIELLRLERGRLLGADREPRDASAQTHPLQRREKRPRRKENTHTLTLAWSSFQSDWRNRTGLGIDTTAAPSSFYVFFFFLFKASVSAWIITNN